MGLETPVSGGLVIRAGAALVNLAQNPSSHCSLLPLQKAIALLYLNTTVILSPKIDTDLGEGSVDQIVSKSRIYLRSP